MLTNSFPCFSQVEVSVSAGPFKSFTAYKQTIHLAPGGRLSPNQGESTLSASIQANMPIKEKFRFQAGIRFLDKHFRFNQRFYYPNQFLFETSFVPFGLGIEMPVNLIYEFPKQILGRSLRLNTGISLARNNIHNLTILYNTDIFTPAPNTIAYSFNHEIINSKHFLTPGIEAGFEITPLVFRNIDLHASYHLDLVPAFGGVHYQYKFHFTSSSPFVLDEPEGIIQAKYTSYFLVQLSYRLPFFKDKNKEIETKEIEEE